MYRVGFQGSILWPCRKKQQKVSDIVHTHNAANVELFFDHFFTGAGVWWSQIHYNNVISMLTIHANVHVHC